MKNKILKIGDTVYVVGSSSNYTYWICKIIKVEHHKNSAKTISYHLEAVEKTRHGIVQQVEIDSEYINGRYQPIPNLSIYTDKKILFQDIKNRIDEYQKDIYNLQNKLTELA